MKYNEFALICVGATTSYSAQAVKTATSTVGKVAGGALGGAAGIVFSPVMSVVGLALSTVFDKNPAASMADGAILSVKGGAELGGYLLSKPLSGLGLIFGGGLGLLTSTVVTLAAAPVFAVKDKISPLWDSKRRKIDHPSTSNTNTEGNSSTEQLTPLEKFISQRTEELNQHRLNQALIGKKIETNPRQYEELQQQFVVWIKEKLGPELFDSLRDLILAQQFFDSNEITDIPMVPVIISKKVYCLTYLAKVAHSKNLPENEIFVPHTREIIHADTVQPSFLSQSVIERLLNRIYQFRAESKNLNNQDAIALYKTWRDSEKFKNIERLQQNLPDGIDANQFIAKLLQKHPDALPNPAFTQMLSTKFPNVPVMYKGELFDASELKTNQLQQATPAYDVQNNIEHIIYLAHELPNLDLDLTAKKGYGR
jgi:hypothetical protein